MNDLFSLAFLNQFEWPVIILICIFTLITSAIHGATGVAGGFLLSAALALIIGVKPIVPIISVALLVSHATRGLLNFRDFDKLVFLHISLAAIPFIIIVAIIYGKMSSTMISIFLGIVILSSIPLRHLAKNREIKIGRFGLSIVGTIYGGLSGASVGPGMLLVPFMLGYGLSKEAFVATLACSALVTNIVRVSVFGSMDLLMGGYFMLGILIGLVTIPGNWIGRVILRKMSLQKHNGFVDLLSILGALNFFWLAIR